MDEVRKEITERDVILISAFLHDIGKFYQRSLERGENHEKLGAECFDEYFREPLKQVGFNDEQLEEIRKNINNHHTSPR
ncbi:MAG: HD domain-containing protein, partial [Acidobacteria bacterium]|nr:HD domain-containing protein [Acidobacteriota bacterium]